MLKKLYNEALIEFEFEPDGPILVKSGKAEVSGVDMAFVRTKRNGRDEVFIPGSSLKGVLRSYSEKILRTINESAVCMPTDDTFCGEKFKRIFGDQEARQGQIAPPERVYEDSCLACKLFGSTYFIGRLSTTDAYLSGGNPKPEMRDCVSIDRFTGGAANRAKFDMEVLTQGKFKTEVHIRNFELWQLALTLQSVADMLEGYVRIGFGKSRGLGKIRGDITGLHIYYFCENRPIPRDLPGETVKEIWGIGKFENGYGFDSENDVISLDDIIINVEDKGLRYDYMVPDPKNSINKLLNLMRNKVITKAGTFRRPDSMC